MKTIVAAILMALVMLHLSGPASGQSRGPLELPPQEMGPREVPMVRQDFSDCQNHDVRPGVIGGTASLVRGTDGMIRVRVQITAQPNTTYHFYLKCVRLLGNITTQEDGKGTAAFSFSTGDVGNIFAFDMYPEGAPSGSKYQSVQVKY